MAPIITPAELLKEAKSKWHDITQKAIHANPVETSHLPFAFNAALELHEHLSKYRSQSTVKGVKHFLSSQAKKRKISSSSSGSDSQEDKVSKKSAVKSSRKSNVQSSAAATRLSSKSLGKNSQRVLKDGQNDQRSKLLLGGTSHQQTSLASKKVSTGPAKKAKEDIPNKVIQQQSKVLPEAVPRQSNTQTTKKISPDRNLKKAENVPSKDAERNDQNSNLLLDIASQQQTSQASLKVTSGLVMKESVPKKEAEHNGQQSKYIPVAAPQQSTSQPSSLPKQSSEESGAKRKFYWTMTTLWQKRIGFDLLEKFYEAHVRDNETAAKWYHRNDKRMTTNSNFVIVVPSFWTIDETVDTMTRMKENGAKIVAIISQKDRADSLDLMNKIKAIPIATRRIETVKDVQKIISSIIVPTKKSR